MAAIAEVGSSINSFANHGNLGRRNITRSVFFGWRANAEQNQKLKTSNSQRSTPNCRIPINYQLSTINLLRSAFVLARNTAQPSAGCQNDLLRQQQRSAREHRRNGFFSGRRTTPQSASGSPLRSAIAA